MKQSTYSRFINCLAIVGIGAAFFYDRAGDYAWLTLVIAGLSGLAAVVLYFYYHWSRRAVDTVSDDSSLGTQSAVGEGQQIEAFHEGHYYPFLISRRSSVTSTSSATHSVLSLDKGWFAPAPFDPREVGKLLVEMEKNKWICTGTLLLQPPTKDVELRLFMSEGTVRFVPSFNGSHLEPRQKQPLSKATPPRTTTPFGKPRAVG